MKLLLVLVILVSCGGCSRKDYDYTPPALLDQALEIYDEACNSFVPQNSCDSGTFVAAMSAICPQKDFNLSAYERSPGVWWRTADIDCFNTYDENGSRLSSSQCSRDTFLWVLLGAYWRKDFAAIKRIADTGEKLDWLMCDGDTAVTSIKTLVPIIHKILNDEGYHIDDSADGIGEDIVEKTFAGFRGHLIAGYLWLRASVYGGLTTSLPLEVIHNETPDSPWFSALFHRFSTDNDQTETVDLLKKAPTEGEGNFGWGSSPWQFHRAAPYKVLDGTGSK